MVFDLAKYKAGQPLPKNTFVVAEQIPGLVEVVDKSAELQSLGFWASYNVAALPEVQTRSGFTQKDHDTAPRAIIFKARQANATTLQKYADLLRYNDYLHDPASKVFSSL